MASRNKARLIWMLCGWLLVISVIYLSLTPTPPQTMAGFSDKIGHFLAYALLMAWWHQIDHNACRLALLFVLMGLLMEILQGIGGIRHADIFDMTANTLGVGSGWFMARYLRDYSAHMLAP